MDFVLGLLRHPTIDLGPGGFRAGLEVGLVNVGLIFALGDFQKGGQERMTFLRPQRVGDVQFDALLLAGFAELALEFAEGGMELPLSPVEMEDSAHLLLSLAACAGAGHRQGSGDAVRREEEVAWLGLKLAVKVQGKGRVAINEGLGLSRARAGRRAENG